MSAEPGAGEPGAEPGPLDRGAASGPGPGVGDEVIRDLRRSAAPGSRRPDRVAPAPPGGSRSPADGSGRHRTADRPGRRFRGPLAAVLAAVLVASLASVVVVVVLSRGSSDDAPVSGSSVAAPAPSSASAPEPSVAEPAGPGPGGLAAAVAGRRSSWPVVLAALEGARTSAWRTWNADALRAVDVPGSPAERADLDALAALRDEGVRPEGLLTEVRSVRVVAQSADRVELRVVDRRSAYLLRNTDGVVVRRVPARGDRTWTVELLQVNGAWLVRSVT